MFRSLRNFSVGLALVVIGASVTTGDDSLTVTSLRCEYLQDPLGIDELNPRLSWRLESNTRGQKQTAYRILVASSVDKITTDKGDIWDSGKVESSESLHIVFAGEPLASRQRCYWKVRAWDRDNTPSKWSDVASWSMGLLNDADWSAKYVSYRDEMPIFKDTQSHFLPAARYYRREFSTGKKRQTCNHLCHSFGSLRA